MNKENWFYLQYITAIHTPNTNWSYEWLYRIWIEILFISNKYAGKIIYYINNNNHTMYIRRYNHNMFVCTVGGNDNGAP